MNEVERVAALKSLNSELRGVDKLEDIVRLQSRLKDSRSKLESELGISGGKCSGRVEVLARAGSATDRAEEVQRQWGDLEGECSLLLKSSDSLAGSLSEILESYELKLKQECYRNLVKSVSTASDRIQEHVRRGEFPSALAKYCQLFHECRDLLQFSNCRNLVGYADGTLQCWFQTLCGHLSSALLATLSDLHYPFVSLNSQTSSDHSCSQTLSDRLRKQLEHLSQLDSSRPASVSPDWGFALSEPLRGARVPPSLVVRALLAPLVRRFRFHFGGDRATARADRPEWHLSLAVQWLINHELFLERQIQPHVQQVDVWREFSECIQLVMADKLMQDLPSVVDDDSVYSHTIDESLRTVRRLEEVCGSHFDFCCPLLSVLRRPPYIKRWLQIEAKSARLRMDELFSSKSACKPLFSSDNDQNGITELSHELLSLLQTITQRYSLLPQPADQLKFLQLQLELLDELRVRLLQLLRQENHQPLSVSCMSLANTAHHVRATLEEWAELPFFLRLQMFQSEVSAAEKFELHERSQDATETPLLPSDDHGSLGDLNYTVFDSYIQLFSRVESDIISLITDQVMSECSRDVEPFCNDDWCSKPDLSEFSSPSLSISACRFIQSLSGSLQQAESSLCSALFERLRARVSGGLSRLLLDKLVLNTRFSVGGCQQLDYDVTRCLSTVLGGQQQLIAPLVHACSLLVLPLPRALGALHVLEQGEGGGWQVVVSGLDVGSLTAGEVGQILRSRTDVLLSSSRPS